MIRSSIVYIINLPYFLNPSYEFNVELNSDYAIDLFLIKYYFVILLNLLLDAYGYLIVRPCKKSCEGTLVKTMILNSYTNCY